MVKGDMVAVDIGHKTLIGIVVEYNGGEYITVKHDNFAGEVFNASQITQVFDKELIWSQT